MMTRDEIRFCLQAMGMTIEQIIQGRLSGNRVLSEAEAKTLEKIGEAVTELYVDLCTEPGPVTAGVQ